MCQRFPRRACACAILFSLFAAASFDVSLAQPRALDGEASFKFDPMADGVPAPITVGAKRRLFLVETGSTISVFDASLRDDLGTPSRLVRMATAGGVAQAELFNAPQAKLGDHPLRGLSEVMCIDLSQIRSAIGSEIYGLIGMDFLRSQIVRIDFDRGELALLRSVPDGAGVAVPLDFSLGLPTVTLAIEGIGDLTFLIDTGALGLYSGVIEKAVLDPCIDDGRAVVLNRGRLLSSDNKVVESRSARVHEITLGGFRHRGPIFNEASCNALGLGYLSRYQVTFDFPNAKMYLKPGARFNQPHRYDLGGTQLCRFGGKTTARRVGPRSAAGVAGLRNDDVIEEFDARPAESLTLLQMQRAFCEPGTHKLRVARGDKRLDIVVVLVGEQNTMAPRKAQGGNQARGNQAGQSN